MILGASLALVTLAPAAQATTPTATCDGRTATIVGTEGADTLTGTNGNDVIVGLGGNDTIRPGNGDDLVCAGAGDDDIDGGRGNDRVFAGSGKDILVGGNGVDELYGEAGDDNLTGGNGDDLLDGGDGDDSLDGGNGTDRLIGGTGNDQLVAGNGDDDLQGGPGTDTADGGNGTDLCSAAETNIRCETVTNETPPLSANLTVTNECRPSLTLDATTEQDRASNGTPIAYDVVVRNDPTGACLQTNTPATVSAVAHLTSTLTHDEQIASTAVWLELPAVAGKYPVAPATAGLSTDGSDAASGCPGGTIDGCASTIGNTVGYVEYPQGTTLSLTADGTLDIPFRLFPTLQDDDRTTLASGPATLAFAATTASGELLLTRSPITFTPPSASGPVTVSAALPSGVTTASLGQVGPGQQAAVDSLFSYTVAASDPDVLSVGFTATDGTATTAPSVVDTVIVASEPIPTLQPAVWPLAFTAGQTANAVVSVAPIGEPGGPLTVTFPGGTAGATDDGTGADLVEGDGVYTANINWEPTDPGVATFEAAAYVDGTYASGTVDVVVLPAGIPSTLETRTDLHTITQAGTTFESDRVNIVTDPAADANAVRDAVEAAGGTLVGLIRPGSWEVALPAATSRADIDGALARLSTSDLVIGASPSYVAKPDDLPPGPVRPNDPMLGLQNYLSQFRIDTAWVAQAGLTTSVIVAVIDSSIDIHHEDLEGRVLPGRNMITGTNVVSAGTTCRHGTHVSGTIAAKADNGIGVAGVNWSARILPVVIFPATGDPDDPCGESPVSRTAAAIDYAVAHGAATINMSLSGGHRSEDVVAALAAARNAGRVVVAAAGNTGKEERRYPSGYGRTETFTSWFGLSPRTYDVDILSVGAVENDRGIASFSTWDSTVDIFAPGVGVLSTVPGNGYATMSGTSMATPVISGIVSLIQASEVWGLSPDDVRVRLLETSWKGSGHVTRVVDAYEAVVNASFEAGTDGWRTTGQATTPHRLGPIVPILGDSMLAISTGGNAVGGARSTPAKNNKLPHDALKDGRLRVSLYYNFVSEEYPEFVNTGFNDAFKVTLGLGDLSSETLVDESVNTTAWTPVTGIDFPGGDTTVGQSGWRYASVVVDASRLAGYDSLQLFVTDIGDTAYDSVGLIDAIWFS